MNRNKILMLCFVVAMIVVCLVKLGTEEVENFATDELDSRDITKVLLYYFDTEKGMLTPEYRAVELERVKDNVESVVIEELLKGPAVSGFESVIPVGTKVNLIEVDEVNRRVSVDFSKEFLVDESESEEDRVKKIFSVVYTLTEIKEIDVVEIKVEGESYAVEERG